MAYGHNEACKITIFIYLLEKLPFNTKQPLLRMWQRERSHKNLHKQVLFIKSTF